MKRILQKLTPFVALALLSFASARVEAAPILLAPGTTTPMTAANDQGALSPGTLLATLTQSFSINSGQLVGQLISAVYMNAAGFVDFYYQVKNTTAPGGTGNNISGVAGSNFAPAVTSVAYYGSNAAFGLGSPFAAPAASNGGVPLSASRNASGSNVGFFFGPPFGGNRIGPGETSSILMIATNFHNWTVGSATIQNGAPAASATVRSFQVPEPASGTLALLGLAFLAGIRRRQAK